MFKPKFNYTDQMVGLLTRIAAAREVILGAPLVPRWEISLRREAIVRSAHSSTSIEGNNLSLEQVSDLAAGRKIMAAITRCGNRLSIWLSIWLSIRRTGRLIVNANMGR
jgi:Fic family protein